MTSLGRGSDFAGSRWNAEKRLDFFTHVGDFPKGFS